MNWDAIGALAELLGAAGVIASLAYLAGQIRQNSQSVRNESVRQLLGLSSQLFMSGATCAENVSAQVKAGSGEDLTEEDRTRLGLLTMAILSHDENELYQYRSGFLPEETRQLSSVSPSARGAAERRVVRRHLESVEGTL